MVITKMTVKKRNLSAKSHPVRVAFNYFPVMCVTISSSVAKSNFSSCELLLQARPAPHWGSPRPRAPQSRVPASLQRLEVGVETQKWLSLHGEELWAPPAKPVAFAEPSTTLCLSALACGLPGTVMQRQGTVSTAKRRPGAVSQRGGADSPEGAGRPWPSPACRCGRSRHSVTACPRPSGTRPPRPTGPSPPRSAAFSVPLCHFDFAEWETRLQPGLAGAGHCAQLTCAGGRSSERGAGS